MAAQRNTIEEFNAQIASLNAILSARNTGAEEASLLELAAQSGAPVSVLRKLKQRLADSAELPATIQEWVQWAFNWLSEDEHSRLALLGRERGAICGSVGRKIDSALSSDVMKELLPGVLAWVSGQPVCKIEGALGGDPDTAVECPRARRLITSVIPLGLTFVMGLVARTSKEIPGILDGSLTPRSVIECLPTAVRRGFDTALKLAFAELRPGLLTRIQVHHAYELEVDQSVTVDSIEDYGSIVARVRSMLARSRAQ
jgi:hypothetical protein